MADKQAVVEGLARLVAGLPPPHLQEAAARLTQPFAAHATALARGSANGSAHGGAAPGAAARQAMAEDLQLVAGALRYLSHGASLASGGGDGAAGDEAALVQPVVAVLEEVREVLATVVASQGWHADESVAGAAAEVYRRAICSARRQGAVVSRAGLGWWGPLVLKQLRLVSRWVGVGLLSVQQQCKRCCAGLHAWQHVPPEASQWARSQGPQQPTPARRRACLAPAAAAAGGAARAGGPLPAVRPASVPGRGGGLCRDPLPGGVTGRAPGGRAALALRGGLPPPAGGHC